MDLTRLARGEMLAAAAVPLLFVVMYFPWYSAPVGEGSLDAWGAGSSLGLVLTVAMVCTGILFLLKVTGTAFEFPFEWLVAGTGALAFLLVAYRIVDPPLSGVLELQRNAGIWLGLACCAAIAAGGFWATREETQPIY